MNLMHRVIGKDDKNKSSLKPAGNPSEMEIKRPFATILVISMAKYFNQRHIIRNTWYKWASRLNIRIFFVIGFHNGGDELFKVAFFNK